jgi:hypothetical protein
MKKTIWCVLGAFALTLISGAAFARSVQDTVVADIPFAFNIGNTELPAGQYEIYPQSDSGLNLVIRNLNTGRSIITPTVTRIESRGPAEPVLVFDKVNDKSYLAEVRPDVADGFLLKVVSQKHARVLAKSS